MSGILDLNELIRSATPELIPGEFVFVSLPGGPIPANLTPICTFVEAQAMTVIVSKEQAMRAGLPFEGTFRQITLNVHSSLEAIGFLAAITSALAAEGIPANAVSAFHHDHLFVPANATEKAMVCLANLVRESPDGLHGFKPAAHAIFDLSHTIEHGMITYRGLPAPLICDFLSREASRKHYAEGTEFHIGRIDMVANTGTYNIWTARSIASSTARI